MEPLSARRKRLPAWLMLLVSVVILQAVSQAASSPEPVTHGPRDQQRVALTFDLCQVPGRPAGFDETIIRILEERGASATFFVGGDWMRTHPADIRRLAANPHFEIGNHSWSHPDLRRLDRAAISGEVARTAAELKNMTGRTSRLFRLPFGWADRPTLETLQSLGLVVIQWDVVTGDPDPGISARDILKAVHDRTRNGSIIIMHANGRGRHTAEALPGVLDDLARQGFELTTVSRLLRVPETR